MERQYVRFIPAEQRVLVLPDEGQEKVTKGGIIIPDTTEQSKPNFGRVISVGLGCEDSPMKYRAGQRVMYSKYAGSEITVDLKEGSETFDDTEFKVMNQSDIWGVIVNLV